LGLAHEAKTADAVDADLRNDDEAAAKASDDTQADAKADLRSNGGGGGNGSLAGNQPRCLGVVYGFLSL
jgi:hypothetical protein